eukprot:4458047-Pyramimonas_sp.AAC.1
MGPAFPQRVGACRAPGKHRRERFARGIGGNRRWHCLVCDRKQGAIGVIWPQLCACGYPVPQQLHRTRASYAGKHGMMQRIPAPN